ncbi:Ni/Co efflux regulator RcnB [Rhizobium aethiopicum]|uniref:Ni/Co efflux regulator RcnB n=1 Tax=Rhizobium aethiopicum TaxID=1138170 RepID=A0A7W6QDX6_9HYPH|nr:Ni/Co efflux regulator RcnB [Rhizobium aethiopicum]MBB4583420.1 Ni/Co efflux regulator RcnB [Rhizobium aethiopicum]
MIVKKTVVRPHWKKGYRVNARERRHFHDINDYRRYRLPPPPRGYRWFRADNDFLLLGVTSGVISSIIVGR